MSRVSDAASVSSPVLSPSLGLEGARVDAALTLATLVDVRDAIVSLPDSAEKLRIMRTVAAGAGHDLANLLCVMGCSLDLLAFERLSPEGAEAVSSLRAEVLYLRGLGRELQMAATETVALNADRQTRLSAWWPQMRALFRAVQHEGVVVRALIPWGLPAVRITADHLTQVVLNLVGNASQADHGPIGSQGTSGAISGVPLSRRDRDLGETHRA